MEHYICLDKAHEFYRYLWPHFAKSSSDQLVLSIALITTVKAHENIPIWGDCRHKSWFLIVDPFKSKVDAFPELFRRVLAMTSVTTISFTARRLLLAFVIHALQSLDVGFVK